MTRPGCGLEDILAALRASHGIWVRLSPSSAEARTAANALRIVLGKLIPPGEAGSGDEDFERAGIDEAMYWNPG